MTSLNNPVLSKKSKKSEKAMLSEHNVFLNEFTYKKTCSIVHYGYFMSTRVWYVYTTYCG